MAGNESLVSTLRAEIERKYREAIQALETLSGYLADAPAAMPTKTSQVPASIALPSEQRPVDRAKDGTRVEMVLAALNSGFKTVEELHRELGIAEDSIRAVLYSKFVKHKIARKKIGKKQGFCLKSAFALLPKTSGDVSVASLVRECLTKHPQGQTPAQVAADISAELAEIGGNKKAVAAALYNMKTSGKVVHDETAGTYRLAN